MRWQSFVKITNTKSLTNKKVAAVMPCARKSMYFVVSHEWKEAATKRDMCQA